MIQTVKQRDGAGGFTRGEWEFAVPAETLDLDELRKTPVGKMLKGDFQKLNAVFCTTVKRSVRSYRHGKSLIEVAFDSGTITAGDLIGEPILELELELKEGDVGELFALGRSLVMETSIGLSFESKSDRGSRVSNQTELEPRLSGDSPCSSTASAGELFRQLARACLAQAAANADLFRIVQKTETVHQMRVGVRRLGAALAAFKPMLMDREVNAIERELKWFAAELDAARDLDVFIEGAFLCAIERADSHDFDELGQQLIKAQSAAYARALAAVRSQRYAIMLFDTAIWIETGPWARTEEAGRAALREMPGKEFAIEALGRLDRRTCKRGRKFARLDSAKRHKLRIRAKELGTTAEFFAPIFKRRTKARTRFLATLGRLQDRLGELSDVATAQNRILTEAGLGRLTLAFSAGRVTGRIDRDQPALLRRAAVDCKRFRRVDRFWH